ncbi:MAG: DUF5320 family protein [Deltaproteobacteria bacterium]|nr:DUF5320 family protein [Deltaproteobacteria bacterium]
MPNYDTTGPQGGGPGTGGGFGYCQGARNTSMAGRGRGFGRRGGGRGFGGYAERGRFFRGSAPMDIYPPERLQPTESAMDSASLKAYAAQLKGEIAAVEARLSALETTDSDKPKNR